MTNQAKRTREDTPVESEAKKTKADTPSSLSGSTWRQMHKITVVGENLGGRGAGPYVVPDPLMSFESTPFSPEIKKCLTGAGFSEPTNTQAQSWPIALSGRDLISVARTGSGKTVGFLLPSYHKINLANVGKRGAAPCILVLAPTRELATQIDLEAKKFGRAHRIRSTCLYGGSPKSIQIRALQNGVECLIATPGRLNDLLNMGKVNLRSVHTLILDEADRMLDMGFEPQIRSIAEHIPRKENRQTLLFSATWPKTIQRLANEFLTNPVQLNMGEVNVLHANKDITQNIEILDERDKEDKLNELLKKIAAPDGVVDTTTHAKTIVFVGRKRVCEKLANEYWDSGYACDALHGDKEQWQRTKTMSDFKRGITRILFATDVAARGLDVKDVEVVINMDMPEAASGIEDYVHRIGRTGRAGAKGTSYAFMTSNNSGCARKLIEILKHANQNIPEGLIAMSRRGGGGKGGNKRFGRFGGNRRGGGRGGGGGRGRRW